MKFLTSFLTPFETQLLTNLSVQKSHLCSGENTIHDHKKCHIGRSLTSVPCDDKNHKSRIGHHLNSQGEQVKLNKRFGALLL